MLRKDFPNAGNKEKFAANITANIRRELVRAIRILMNMWKCTAASTLPNLSFTKVDDKAALDLLKLPHLEEVYLYRADITKEVINAIQKYRPGLKIYLQEGPYF